MNYHIKCSKCPLLTDTHVCQWRRQLLGTGHMPPPFPTISVLVHFGVNLTDSYPSRPTV